MAHFIPCNNTLSGEEAAQLFMDNVFKLHSFPQTIVSDRGTQFCSHFWQSFFALVGVRLNYSTAYHPETDGSTKVLNQMIEQYLHIHCNYQQDYWIDHLPLAEFTYNNSISSTTGMTPFFANTGSHPVFDPATTMSTMSPNPAAANMANDMQRVVDQLVFNLGIAQESYTLFAN